MNWLFFSRFNLEFTILFPKLLRIRYKITRKQLWNHYELTIFFAKSLWINYRLRFSLWIHFLFCDFTMYSQSVSRKSYESTILFAKSIWIHYLFPEFTLNRLFSPNHYKFTIFLNSLSFFANPPWIHYLLRQITMNSLPVSRIIYEFAIWFAILLWLFCISLWIYFLLR